MTRVSMPLAGSLPTSPEHSGFALGRKGFRPFFLLSAAFAATVVPLWMLALLGAFSPGAYLDPIAWHAHEMVFGFSVAVIAGFLLTAVGNWTQRETLVGWPLMGLGGVWLLGRAGFLASDHLPRWAPAVLDLAFLPALGVVLARPLIATRNRRNFVMLAVLAALWLADLSIHLDALGEAPGWRRRGVLSAVDVVVLLIVIVAGRVVPMFTKNGTGVQTVHGSPRLDAAAAASTALLAVLMAALPSSPVTRVVAGVAAVATAARAVPWMTPKVLRVPLLWVLHIGYAWIPIGFALRAFGAPEALATHALTIGAIGGVTLGMMARVGLGHSGRPLQVRWPMVLSFALLALAALVRVAGGLLFASSYRATLFAAGTLWTVAFAILLVVYAPIFATPRADGKPG